MEKEGLETNPFFKKPLHCVWIWISPDGQNKNEIEFIMSKIRQIFNDVSVIHEVKIGGSITKYVVSMQVQHGIILINYFKHRALRHSDKQNIYLTASRRSYVARTEVMFRFIKIMIVKERRPIIITQLHRSLECRRC